MKIAKLKAGFTLIELLVSIGLFLVVVTMSLGAVLSVIDHNSRSQSVSSVMNNLNYSLDSITRGIRFGTNYHCPVSGILTPPLAPVNCTNGDSSVAVSSSTDPSKIIVYRFQNNNIQESHDGGATYKDAIGDEVTVQYARFYVYNTVPGSLYPNPGSLNQPYVLLVIKGIAGKKTSTQATFDLETIISQRKLDL